MKKFEAWGKAANGGIHPLAHHCMDVASVFMRLAELPVVRKRLETAAKKRLLDADVSRIGVLAFLHDIGKLHPGFQAKNWPEGVWRSPVNGHVKEGCAFITLAFRNRDHPFHDMAMRLSEWGCEAVGTIMMAAFSHHGRPIAAPADPTLIDWDAAPDCYDWRGEAAKISKAIKLWFPDAFQSGAASLPNAPLFHHLTAGLMALADWIGSDTRFFPYSDPFDFDYGNRARTAAATALADMGADAAQCGKLPPPSFADIANGWTPNPAQAAIGKIGLDERLVILEAETGSGKTEAALWRFAQLFAAGRVSGLYFAVPTRAAAKQIHRRINGMVRRWLGESAPEVVLAVPGLLKSGEATGRRLPHWSVLWDDDDASRGTPHRWAAEHSTRYLAAPIAVGTVDQAMLSGLQVKHAHMRGAALSRSLLVVDEVHASDSYMTAVLEGVLEAHLDMGGYALLMSATLGSAARCRWMGGQPPNRAEAVTAPYPAVWRRGVDSPIKAESSGPKKVVSVQAKRIMGDVEATAALAMKAAAQGAKVLVVRNTVRKAIETWRAVIADGGEALLMQASERAALHHSRFSPEDRALIDNAVETSLCADAGGRTKGGLIAIGTQTLEQSLDIDADHLITDLCPMDVLLQRMGRLHRHSLRRPKGYRSPHAVVLAPEDGLDQLTAPRFVNGLGGWPDRRTHTIQGVYMSVAMLELTLNLVESEGEWRIPDMNRRLVEGATHPEAIESLLADKGSAWRDYESRIIGAETAAGRLANLVILNRNSRFDETDAAFPGSDEHVATRLGADGMRIELDTPLHGPFGLKPSAITLPANWSKGLSPKDKAACQSMDGGLLLRIGGREFFYTAAGLERRDAA